MYIITNDHKIELEASLHKIFTHTLGKTEQNKDIEDSKNLSLWPRGIRVHLWRNRLCVRVLVVSDKSYPMFIEPMITWVLLGFSGYIWLDTKIMWKLFEWRGIPSLDSHVRCYMRNQLNALLWLQIPILLRNDFKLIHCVLVMTLVSK